MVESYNDKSGSSSNNNSPQSPFDFRESPGILSFTSSEIYQESLQSSFEGTRSSLRSQDVPTVTLRHPSFDNQSDDILPAEKKKKNKKIKRAMRSMLPNTDAKSREKDFHKLFKSLPDTESLIEDFSCALLRDILVQGRLYISQNWFCFYANILGWETLLTIEVTKITAIKKEKTALVINNAISITTQDEKYFFSSFMSRDSAHSQMCRIWKSTPLPKQSSEDLDNSDYSDDDEDDEDEDEDEDFETEDAIPVYRPVLPRDKLSVPKDHHHRQGSENISYNAEDETCSCVTHYPNEHLNQDFEMSTERMYKLLFSDESSIQSKMKVLAKMEEYEASPWHDSVEGANERTLTYKVPLSANLGPKWAEVIEKQVLTKNYVASKCYVVNCEVTNPNVPYGDKFNIVKRYCITRAGERGCRLRLTSDVQYRKGVWGMVKSIIEKNSREGLNDYCENLCMSLAEETAGPGVKVRKSAAGRGVGTLQHRPRVSTTQEPRTRSQRTISFITNNYIAFILLMMAVLLSLNLILMYRLSSITNNCQNQLDILNSIPHSEEGVGEWRRILAQQEHLHIQETKRWRETLSWINKLLSEVHTSLKKLEQSSTYKLPKNEL